MSLKVNPEKDGEENEFCGAGRKLSHAVGISRWTASTGTPMLTMGFVVLRDSDDGKDNGKVFTERFAITQKAVFRIARWALAYNYRAEFDAQADEDVKKIMAKGPIVAVLAEGSEYKGKKRIEVESFAPYTGDYDPAWDAKISAGEAEFGRIVMRMAEAAERNSNSGPTGGYGGATGGYGNGGDGRPTAPPQADDDIPF